MADDLKGGRGIGENTSFDKTRPNPDSREIVSVCAIGATSSLIFVKAFGIDRNLLLVTKLSTTLFIETSGPYCSLALRSEGKDFVESRLLNKTHNEHVLAMLNRLYEENEIERLSTNLVGFSAGPGSFTGVRIGAAIAQALAFASGGKVLSIQSPMVLAMTAFERFKQSNWWVSVKSRKNLFYLANYKISSRDVQVIQAPELFDLEPEWLMEIKNSGNGVGEQPQWLVDIESDRFHTGLYPEADSVLDLIEQLHLDGKSKDPEFALPVYLEGDSPWVKAIHR